MKMNRHFPTAVRLLLLAAMAMGLSGCLSHWFTDSTTRLQIENKTKYPIYGIDVVSEDGSKFIPWIQDTIRAGERSRVYEEDWVGKFRVRVNWPFKTSCVFVACETSMKPVYDKSLRKEYTEEDVVVNSDAMECWESKCEEASYVDLKFEGGSQYLVVTIGKDKKARFEFK